MKKPLEIYRGQVALICKRRDELTFDLAQVLAEAFNDGHSAADLFTAQKPVTPIQEFDL